MDNSTKRMAAALGVACSLIVVGCASAPTASSDAAFMAMMKSSFRDQGIAKVDRLKQDLAQAACSSDKAPDEATAQRIMAEAKATVKWPAGGRYIGEWRDGEKLAQSGRGMTWSDKSTDPKGNGGNCYNCHQLSKEEVSFGTIGPSLYHYGKNRGVTSLTSPSLQPIAEYTWTKLYNARAYTACSQMPRFGHASLLNEEQIRDIMALLLDPDSPINK